MAESMIFRSRLDSGKSIARVLLGVGVGKLLMSTCASDHFWSMDGQQLNERIHSDISGIRTT